MSDTINKIADLLSPPSSNTGGTLTLSKLRKGWQRLGDRTFGTYWNKRVLTPDQIAERDANPPEPLPPPTLVVDSRMYADMLIMSKPTPESEEEGRLLIAQCEGKAERVGGHSGRVIVMEKE